MCDADDFLWENSHRESCPFSFSYNPVGGRVNIVSPMGFDKLEG